MSGPRSLQTLLAGFDAPAPDLDVTGLELDSRRVTPGDVFLAARGTGTQHGLDFVEQALERGAAAVVWEPAPGRTPPEVSVPCVALPELSRRAGEIAARFYGRPSAALYVAGVTGTDGKTSTAHLIAQGFEFLQTPCAYVGTLGSGRLGTLAQASHTTPDAVQLQRRLAHLREQGVRAAALEVSSHALDQDRVSGLHFNCAILTNITRDHLDYHQTVERYAAAKQRLFTHYAPDFALLNRDDARGAGWAAELGSRAAVYGLDGAAPAGAHLIGRDLRLHSGGLSMTVDSSWGQQHLQSRLLGRFNAYNLLAALGALLHAGVPMARAAQALSQAGTVPGRIEGFRAARGGPLAVVDYAHTPDALEQILKAVRAHCAGRLWCVFGCGGDRDRGKRPLMGAAAARFADRVIVTDDNPRSESPAAIAAEIVAALPSGTRVIHDRAEAIRTALREAADDDVVVIAGKGHEQTQTYGSEVRAFSDRDFVAAAMGLEARP